MLRKYLNHLQIHHQSEGNERRYEMLEDILQDSTFLPKTVLYKDIDEAFKKWVEDELPISIENGNSFPTMTLFSNQRFAEYAQTWEYTDSNNNLLLNFKTINRDSNPELGSIVSKVYNIPGERFYLMKRKKVLDKNGSESFLDLKMKIPVAVDLIFKVTVFTTYFQKLNEFNLMINDKFKSRQCYIQPNGHFMPMILDGISDESQNNIDDRQFYSQSYKIKVMAYTIKESDYKVEEIPLKRGVTINNTPNRASVTIEEGDIDRYYHKPLTLQLSFSKCSDTAKFKIDTDFIATNIELVNILNNYSIYINNNILDEESKDCFSVKDGDEIKVKIKKRLPSSAEMLIHGYDPNIIFDSVKDDAETDLEKTQFEETIVVDGTKEN